MRLLLRVPFALLSLGLASGVSACGPSVYAVQEGTLRFEHCYRLDLTTEAAQPHRRACWQEWTSQYTYGQSRDRIEYARRRLSSLAVGDPTRPQLNVEGARRPAARQFYLSVPAPTSARTSPAPIATLTYAPATPMPGLGPRTPGDHCALACQGALVACQSPCEASPAKLGAAGAPSVAATTRSTAATPAKANAPAEKAAEACGGCEPDYKRCMVRCYE